MNKIFVANSYKNCEIIGKPFLNDKNKLYIKIKDKCPRCGGRGTYGFNAFYNTQNCFRCGGSGIEVKNVRAYTKKEYNQMITATERRKEKKELARKEREKDLIENASKYMLETAAKLGFNDDGKAYCVCGESYPIKDYLKENGAKFLSCIKSWVVKTKIDIPESCFFIEISFTELYNYDPLSKYATPKENVKEIFEESRKRQAPASSFSEYFPAQEKERIRDLKVILTKVCGFNSQFGYTFIYTFALDNYIFVWMTTKNLCIEVGDCISLTGTIKKFEEYMGIKQTHLTRCSIKD